MKKLMTLMLGLSLGIGAVSMFAQNAPADSAKTTTKTKKAKKAKKTKKSDSKMDDTKK